MDNFIKKIKKKMPRFEWSLRRAVIAT